MNEILLVRYPALSYKIMKGLLNLTNLRLHICLKAYYWCHNLKKKNVKIYGKKFEDYGNIWIYVNQI